MVTASANRHSAPTGSTPTTIGPRAHVAEGCFVTRLATTSGHVPAGQTAAADEFTAPGEGRGD